MKVIIFGAPGSGKGTQSNIIKNELNIDHISTGELIRKEITKKTLIGEKINKYTTKGRLIPNKIIIEIINKHIKTNKIILDGFPRTLEQAKFLFKKFNDINYIINIISFEKTIIKRIKYRITKNEKNYNILYNKPYIKNKDDLTGEKTNKRADDLLTTIKNRLSEYDKNNKKIINWCKKYNKSCNIINIDGELNIQEITKIIKKIFKQYE